MGEDSKNAPGIAVVMGIIGGLSILGGIILCVTAWPGDPGSGYVWKSTAYTLSITWLFSGFVSGALFFAAAAALTYLHGTREYAEEIARNLHDRRTNEQQANSADVSMQSAKKLSEPYSRSADKQQDDKADAFL